MKSSDNLITRINTGCHELKVPYASLSLLMENNRWSQEVHEAHEASVVPSLWLILRRSVSIQTITGAPSEVVVMD